MGISRYFLPEWEGFQSQMGFSQAVRAKGELLHISGTAALDGNAEVVHPGDMAAQLDYVYACIGRTLKDFGLGFEDLVRQVIYVTDMDALLEAVRARIPNKYFGEDGPYPAATAIQIQALTHPEMLVEIQATAVFPE